MQTVVMLNVIIQSVVMLNVVALGERKWRISFQSTMLVEQQCRLDEEICEHENVD